MFQERETFFCHICVNVIQMCYTHVGKDGVCDTVCSSLPPQRGWTLHVGFDKTLLLDESVDI
jgi:hypothetical protein